MSRSNILSPLPFPGASGDPIFMLIDLLFVAAGLAALVFGGDVLVRGALGLSEKFRLSPAIIGIAVVGFGTSTPELVTSLTAALQGREAVAIGNVVGSNIANILLILGLTALVFPVLCQRRLVFRDGPVLAAATAAVVLGLVWLGFPRWLGLVTFAGLIAYLVISIRAARTPVDADIHTAPAPLLPAVGRSLLGLVVLIVGARLLVDGAASIAGTLGVSEALIGLTVVAIGTSLPELAASVAAAFRRQGEMAFGNILGSNVFNVAGILGLTAIIQPLARPVDIGWLDSGFLVGSAALLLLFGFTGAKVVRWEGAVLVILYAVYVAILATRALA
jgi:cation:H+ antiporter